MGVRFSGPLIFLLFSLEFLSVCLGQTAPLTSSPAAQPEPVNAFGNDPAADARAAGTIAGTVTDSSGALLSGAQVKLSRANDLKKRATRSGEDGRFSFPDIPPGPFQITITCDGFAEQTVSGLLHPGETYQVRSIALGVATAMTEVNVALSPVQVAEEQIKDEERQRVLGVLPNFYVSYDPDAAPLNSKQKFKLAWRMTIDPSSFVIAGIVAGVQQSQNTFSGYGQGAQGYGKRYGASLADFVSGTFISGAILPSVLKQDPRYFYKGTGSKKSRVLYALANSVVCKGDNRRWQPNYSSMLGSLAAGGISNLYYPAQNRNGAGLTFENGAIGIGATAAANVLQEFVMKKVTSNVPRDNPGSP
jgi:Carboxypeptidase regulatory-like domain